ncbi:hypothetical protein CBL_04652 [Carabus blaptoides fortunei]
MYCMIKYGAQLSESDDILYINPDCVLQLLLDHIREEIGIDTELEFDLFDENGERKNVSDFEPSTRATEILEPFATYICVLVERDENGKLNKLTPLISNNNKHYNDISLKLRRYVNPSKRFSYEMKKSSRDMQSASLSQISDKSKKRNQSTKIKTRIDNTE